MPQLPPKIYELLGKVIKDDISRFSISVHSPNEKGEGFLGEMVFVSLEDKNSEKVFHFIVKKAFEDEVIRARHPLRTLFVNEINFYTKIWPRLQQFQDQHLNIRAFDKFPKCFATDIGVKSEKLVLDNLRYQGFETFPKRSTFDKQHMEYIFKQYGRFHATSIAFKALNPQEFSELTRELTDQFQVLGERKSFQGHLIHFHELCLDSLIPGKDDDVIEKYKIYSKDGVDIFMDSIRYRSKYPVILHGDCWSNNMMFKYDDRGNLEDFRLIDLQMSKVGSAVSDLAYCLYSSGSKEIFAEFNHYLELYYNSLSDTLKAFGCDPDRVYPFTVLKEEWKQCCKMGFTMALIVWNMKLIVKSDAVDLTDVSDGGVELSDKMKAAKYEEEIFKKMTRDIILHLYEYDYL